MTAAARFTQTDLKRAAAGVLAAGFERARIIMDLANEKPLIAKRGKND